MAQIAHNIKRSSQMLIKPHITERASILSEKGAYVFVASERATKRDIAHAVKELYNVTPVKVNVISVPSKRRIGRRGIRGVRPGFKKAIIFLKPGEKIDLG
ncbi:MAG TPA: 50S ribosomal protein L23 [Candidatus Vogelbacteria bacterium]|nr:50S ribosomal protein L23 [Candidatus Vogelbacteria bacterium]HBC44098.1 50S ribosomal protein L23 [Candidatus Vogelbacteria bacterium]HCQ92155.1 50S ribosomal protein L23 [Candidatus Vogelbacteria bacterium]